jgi:hypothetical protein
MLMALRLRVEQRQQEHERKVGKGMEDREYQRHVGRIAECELQVQLINEMMKSDLDEVSDFLENDKHDGKRSEDTRRRERQRNRSS